MFTCVDATGKKTKGEGFVIPEQPLDVLILAAEQQAKGKTLDEVCKTVAEAVERNPAMLDGAPEPEVEPAPEAANVDDFRYRWLMAYCRLATGQIHGLPLELLDDVAQVTTQPGVDFETWMKRKGFYKE